jgi:catechol 2,3-dioxygenase-like lactoylglutathione lyase family enzyme
VFQRVTIRVADIAASRRFYALVLAALDLEPPAATGPPRFVFRCCAAVSRRRTSTSPSPRDAEDEMRDPDGNRVALVRRA